MKRKRYVSSIFKKIRPKTFGPDCVFSIIAAVFSPYKQTLYQFTCTDYRAQNNSVGSQVTPDLWVLRMELALCHPSCTKNFDVAPRFLKKLRDPNNGTLIWMLQIFTYSTEQGITKLENPCINILRTNAITEKTCLYL